LETAILSTLAVICLISNPCAKTVTREYVQNMYIIILLFLSEILFC